MIKVLIVEDEIPAQINLKKLIDKCCSDSRIVMTLTSVSSTVKWLEENPDGADVIIGGFPCQGFSVANTRRSMEDKRNVTVNRKHKDSLFRIIFKEKKELLSLYNALAGTSYEKEDELTITTDEEVIYIHMKNDMMIVCFHINNVLKLQPSPYAFHPDGINNITLIILFSHDPHERKDQFIRFF